ncbi:fimbrial protein [Erwinia sp. E602]|uniref:fimbrial protein n=1 Tax=Erwinia sp. E602 TaxID=2675378 RepID=UPI001BAC9031|nr:fimbrial protein [Erwinia sp. E602]QUG77713.1 fimbrial protein [Erwinia sp. E602]
MKIFSVVCCVWALLLTLAVRADEAILIGGEIRFHGRVVALPCSIAPGDETLQVDFKQLSTEDLYLNKQTRPVGFTLHLINCSTTVYKTVTVTFSGERSQALPESLRVHSNASGGTAGIAIDLRQDNGNPLTLDQPTPATDLTRGSMQLGFQALVRGEPDALQQHNLQLGPFTSTASYTLNYQ